MRVPYPICISGLERYIVFKNKDTGAIMSGCSYNETRGKQRSCKTGVAVWPFIDWFMEKVSKQCDFSGAGRQTGGFPVSSLY